MDALLKSYASAGSPRRVLVGLSGGADSVALLVSLRELSRKEGFQLFAVHVNHGLRAQAAADENFCRELCLKLNIPLICTAVKIEGKSNLEAKARRARYAAFAEAVKQTQADVLSLAHHADDQAETVIMHLLYGAGSAGLGGMHACRNGVWRPFLQLRRAELRQYLQEQGITWVEDESNADVSFTRNHIRSLVTPCLEACAPEAVRTIGRTAEILRAEDDFMNQLADEWLKAHASKTRCPFVMSAPLQTRHPALQRRILRRYAEMLGLQLDFQQTERLRHLLDKKDGSMVNLPQNGRALKSENRLHFLLEEKSAQNLGVLAIDHGEKNNTPVLCQAVPADQMHDLQLRTRKARDYIQPFGMQGTKSLKEYMIDHGMDRPFRDSWPLVCRGSEVMWVIGVGASEKLRVPEGAASEHQLIYSGFLPDHV